ncbi:NUDIX hydrolase [Actinocorallia sp. API 0066]|uniref:NUDIX domain-containing protein n=1 Tax=Actinocorallia sp. API 0066 TaxID=2896846 RepID=UPI001E58453C|nr:NUDIX hydrolase [Actinocorallia sp. API 0066]MCD0451343.1 NUDIX hydrolase [Actinocorallia sp. API 0066]
MTSDPTASFARPVVAAGVLFFDHQDRILLVVPTYKDYRDIPGGYVEQGETPHEAAIREVHEELGITPPIGRLLLTDWAPNPTEGDKLLYIFDGGTLTNTHLTNIHLDPAEIATIEFHPVEHATTLTIDRLARRLHHATTARTNNTTLYLEHGTPKP